MSLVATLLLAVTLSGSVVAMSGQPADPPADPPDEQTAEPTAAPSASLSAGVVNPGDTVLVIGTGWPAGVVVQTEVCGNLALNGSIDCNRADAVSFGVAADGSYSANIAVRVPPAPCPCVVKMSGLGAATLLLPIEIFGVPSVPTQQATSSVPVISVSDVLITGSTSIVSRLGINNDRVASVDIVNRGASQVVGVRVVASVDGETVFSSAPLSLAPGVSETVSVPVGVPTLAWGDVLVEVSVDVGGQTVTTSATFDATSWALWLVVLVVVAVVVLTLLLLRRARRRAVIANNSLTRALRDTPAPSPDVSGSDSGADVATRELASLLATALTVTGSLAPRSDTSAIADRLADSVAAEMARRHGLSQSATATLAGRLGHQLASQLQRQPTPV